MVPHCLSESPIAMGRADRQWVLPRAGQARETLAALNPAPGTLTESFPRTVYVLSDLEGSWDFRISLWSLAESHVQTSCGMQPDDVTLTQHLPPRAPNPWAPTKGEDMAFPSCSAVSGPWKLSAISPPPSVNYNNGRVFVEKGKLLPEISHYSLERWANERFRMCVLMGNKWVRIKY